MIKLILAVIFLSLIFAGILSAVKHSSTKEKYQAVKFFLVAGFCVILAVSTLVGLVVLF